MQRLKILTFSWKTVGGKWSCVSHTVLQHWWRLCLHQSGLWNYISDNNKNAMFYWNYKYSWHLLGWWFGRSVGRSLWSMSSMSPCRMERLPDKINSLRPFSPVNTFSIRQIVYHKYESDSHFLVSCNCIYSLFCV